MRFTRGAGTETAKALFSFTSYEMVLRHILREKKELTGSLGDF